MNTAAALVAPGSDTDQQETTEGIGVGPRFKVVTQGGVVLTGEAAWTELLRLYPPRPGRVTNRHAPRRDPAWHRLRCALCHHPIHEVRRDALVFWRHHPESFEARS